MNEISCNECKLREGGVTCKNPQCPNSQQTRWGVSPEDFEEVYHGGSFEKLPEEDSVAPEAPDAIKRRP